ncbi:hypothetical protein, partial [Streptomyces olivaceoviridis]|uniref:hypothetical protein n=1 Tax=Streptomyces olivaceoviridis TaxID=1921 RepID=UPI0033C70AB2
MTGHDDGGRVRQTTVMTENQGCRVDPRRDLVSCAGDPSAELGEGFKDFLGGLGPDERLWVC